MKIIELGRTGIKTSQNGFGALPIQRVSEEEALRLLRKAYESGFSFFDTARGYTDSEHKLGLAFEGMRDKVIIASKSHAKTPDELKKELETTLSELRTDRLDIYQFHMAAQCYRPGDGTGMYEFMLELKEKGKIDHIGITTHRVGVAEEVIESGLYETLQYPFSYLASDREKALVEKCRKAGTGFIAMKALSGGLLTDSRACMAFFDQFDDVVPIWGIQRESELDEYISFFENTPSIDDEGIKERIEKDREELGGDFCRGCGYCAPCSAGIEVAQCARTSLFLRRMPPEPYLSEAWQAKMAKIKDCTGCGLCRPRCPYELDIPELLKKNLEDYEAVLAGRPVR